MGIALGERFDASVIGGGPGGSACATFIAMQGHRVLLLERDIFPRHQIGESLLPATIHGICSLLGLSDAVAKANFTRKRGGTFRWGNSSDLWTFEFARNSDAPGGYAYQVERAKFDKMLLDNARAKGVDVREGHRVEEILFDENRACGVRFTDPTGVSHIVKSRFVIDAGGHRARQYNSHVGARIYSEFFQNVAIFGYFENGKRLPPPNSGNILISAFSDGWFWYIPLSSTMTSVGAVVSRDAAKLLQAGHDAAFEGLVRECPLIAEYLENSRPVSEGMYAGLRVRKDYSYCNERFWIPGLALVGDAACFIDPLFSSGVHLATYAALLAARSVNTSLRGDLPEKESFLEFETRYRREFGNFYQFVLAFYDMHQDTESYFWAARKILNTAEAGNEAFIRLVAGLSAIDEPAFLSSEYFRERAGLGSWFEAYVGNSADKATVASQPSGPSFNRKRFDPDKLMNDLTQEAAQMQLQALYGRERPRERGTGDGLVPSPDGFHWIPEGSSIKQ